MNARRLKGEQAASAEQTRLALIEAGLEQFGRFGFEGAATRQIAAQANANIGSIAYHFGGKEGLHAACASHIVETMGSLAAPVLGADLEPDRLTPQEALAALEMALTRMAGFIVSQPQAGAFVHFVLREMNRPTSAFDIIYSGLFEPVHKRLCVLWAIAVGDEPDSEATSLKVFTMIGQVVYFRIGQEAVQRRMSWDEIGPAQANAIVDAALENLRAAVAAHREKLR